MDQDIVKSKSSIKDTSLENREYVEYSTPCTLTSQFYFCGIPFRMDTFRGCSHQCQYCFANSRKSGTGFGADFQPATANIEFFEKLFKKAFGTEKEFADVNVETLRHRCPVHMGGMSDSFQKKEKEIGITYQVLKLFKEYDYPVLISTKNVLFTEDKYMKILADMKVVMQVSIINSRNIPELEPGASSIEERFKAVKICNDTGIPCNIRLQPFIPGFIKDTDEYIKKVRDTGCKFVTIEHLKLPLDYTVIGQISKALDYDIKKDFQRFAGMGGVKAYGREFELPGVAKYNLLFKSGLVDSFHKAGIKLGLGDNQLHQYSDAKTCCGFDLYKGFENYFKANYTYMTTKTNKREFTFDDLLGDHWIPKEDISDNMNRSIRWNVNNKCRYIDGKGPDKLGKLEQKDLVPNKIYYHLRNKWSNPDLNDSPTDIYTVNFKKTGKKFIDKISGKETNIDELVYYMKPEQKTWF